MDEVIYIFSLFYCFNYEDMDHKKKSVTGKFFLFFDSDIMWSSNSVFHDGRSFPIFWETPQVLNWIYI